MANFRSGPNKVIPNFCATKAMSSERQAKRAEQWASDPFAVDAEKFGRGEMSADVFRAKWFPNA